MRTSLSFAFVVPCYNEAANLPVLLPLLDRARAGSQSASRLLVVSDASSDGTDEIVREFARTSTVPVKLISNPRRDGKSAAINQALRALPDVEIIFMISGDVLPEGDCVRLLIEAFDDESVGVAGGRQLPLGPEGNLAADITRFMWALHHEIATRHPKTTEVTVFRNVLDEIDRTSLVDEAAIELAARRRGYAVRCVPEAGILSPTPLKIADYIKQRTSVTLGYVMVRVLKTQRFSARVVLAAIAIETLIRRLAWIHFLARIHRHGIWGRSQSTKRPLVAAVVPTAAP